MSAHQANGLPHLFNARPQGHVGRRLAKVVVTFAAIIWTIQEKSDDRHETQHSLVLDGKREDSVCSHPMVVSSPTESIHHDTQTVLPTALELLSTHLVEL